MIIRNHEELLSHGNKKARRTALEIIERTMARIDASRITRELVSFENDILRVGQESFDLSETRNVYVLGAGKAVLQIAEALEQILGDRITKGLVIEKRLEGMQRGLERIQRLKRIQVLQGNHPVPDETAVEGSQKILEIAREATARDLVLFCVQGGCTCLTTLPAPGLTLEDIKKTTENLLESGVEIIELNAIRTALTSLSGGRLARYIHPAPIINLVVNDYVLRYPEAAGEARYGAGWGPTAPVPNERRMDMASTLAALDKHGLWDKLPSNVVAYLKKNQPAETLTAADFERLGIRQHTFVLADPQDAAEAACQAASDLGLNAMILSSCLEGEAKEVGIMLAGIATELSRNHRPLAPPCAVIATGEKTVTITGPHGEGGRNQECALSAARNINRADQVVIVSVGTDGTDGPNYVAGGMVDGFTMQRAAQKQINISGVLKRHSAKEGLTALGDAVYFDEPGNNVCDLSLIVVTAP